MMYPVATNFTIKYFSESLHIGVVLSAKFSFRNFIIENIVDKINAIHSLVSTVLVAGERLISEKDVDKLFLGTDKSWVHYKK